MELRNKSSKSKIKGIIFDLQQQYRQKINKYLSQLRKDGNNDKLRTYCFIKTDCTLEKYLLHNIPRVQRSKVTSLRIGSHSLEIEKGRHKIPQIPADKRLCSFCLPQKYIEDECHFLVNCSLFTEKRNNLIYELDLGDSYKSKDDMSKFIFLLTIKLNEE